MITMQNVAINNDVGERGSRNRPGAIAEAICRGQATLPHSRKRRTLTTLSASRRRCCFRRRAVTISTSPAPRCAAATGQTRSRRPVPPGRRNRASRRMQGARERRQTPVRAYANHQVRRQLGRRRRGAPRRFSVGPALMSASGPGGERQSGRECPCGDEGEALADRRSERLLARRRLAPRRRGVALGRQRSRATRASQRTKGVVRHWRCGRTYADDCGRPLPAVRDGPGRSESCKRW